MGRVEHFKLVEKFDVRLSHNIVAVRKGNECGFDISYDNLKDKSSGTLHVDKLVVATGHFSVPNMVHFQGFDTFNGRIIHSHHFRNAQVWNQQYIAC